MINFSDHVRQVSSHYLDGLGKANLPTILNLFTPAALVISPLYGSVPAASFYHKLFADTQTSEVELKDVLTNEAQRTACLFFIYRWTLSSGELVTFEVIDYLAFNEKGLIDSLQIVYDTQHSRKAYQEL